MRFVQEGIRFTEACSESGGRASRLRRDKGIGVVSSGRRLASQRQDGETILQGARVLAGQVVVVVE